MDFGTILGVAGLLVGALGIAIAIYEGRKYRGPILAFQYDGFNLIRSYDAVFPDSIEVTFDGEKVPNLTHSQVVIWNHGHSPLTRNDLSAQDPIHLGFGKEYKILQAEIVKVTSEPNAASISYTPKDSFLKFNFEFLDSQDGVLISVWHTNPRTSPKLSGTIINKNAGPFGLGRFSGPKPNIPEIKSGSRISHRLLRSSNLLSRKPVFMSISLMIVGALFTILLSSIWIIKYFDLQSIEQLSFLKIDPDTKNPPYSVAVAGLLYFFLGFWMWRQVRRRFPKTLLPDEYEVSQELR